MTHDYIGLIGQPPLTRSVNLRVSWMVCQVQDVGKGIMGEIQYGVWNLDAHKKERTHPNETLH